MAEINAVTDLTYDEDIAIITLNAPPVNALSNRVLEGLFEAFVQAKESSATAIVFICEGRTFVAGADISQLGDTKQGPSLQDLQALVEAIPKPVVAAIHGTALGGGLELALCAHYRVAVATARFGLPEVKLGLMPGAGGTQRLPRLVGVDRALSMVTSGEPMLAAEAAAAGLVDELVPEDRLRAEAVDFARRAVREGRPLVRVRDSNIRLDEARGQPGLFAAFRTANARKFRGFLAPDCNIRAVEAAVNLPFEQGLKEERRLFLELLKTPHFAAQRYYFFAERQAKKIPDVPVETPTREITNVGVIGAGTMGGGIAMNFADAGIPVTIIETRQEALERGLSVVRKNYERIAARASHQAGWVDERMGLIKGSLDMVALKDVDLVVEAAFERMEVKQDIFSRLDAICKSSAILASNTSYLNLDEIAMATEHPERVVGLHFFSPANVMKLLEIIRGAHTAKDVVATAMQLSKQIGKVGVTVGVAHGFVGNRMLLPRQREAEALVMEGVMPWEIDRVLYEFGFPMGPFAMRDLAGLDIGWDKEKSKHATVREVLCEMGRFGQKTGAGYYDYDENRAARPSLAVESIVSEFIAKAGATPREISDEEIIERCLYPMINEGAKILEEGMVSRASDIDVVWVNGYGWPVYRGGPMYYANQIGLDEILSKLRGLRENIGEAFAPAALLEKLVAEGKTFADLK